MKAIIIKTALNLFFSVLGYVLAALLFTGFSSAEGYSLIFSWWFLAYFSRYVENTFISFLSTIACLSIVFFVANYFGLLAYKDSQDLQNISHLAIVSFTSGMVFSIAILFDIAVCKLAKKFSK